MRLLSSFMLDLRHAGSGLLRAPAFSVAAVVTLALAIGANTAVFSVVSAVLLRPLPYDEPDRVVSVWNSWDGTDRGRLSPGEYFDYLRNAKAFDAFGVFDTGSVTLTRTGTDPERLTATFVTFGVLRALGVRPLAGTLFTPEDDVPGGDPTLVIGEDLWRRRFSARPDVVGTTVAINGRQSRIVGVLPRAFILPHEFDATERTQIYLPLAFPPELASVRGNHSFLAVARLHPGLRVDDAVADLARIAASFGTTLPGDYPPSRRFSARAVAVGDEVNGAVRPSLLLVLGAIGFLLLIACTNVAGLLLVRGEKTWRSASIRAALGASMFRLASYALSETLVISACAGALGVLIAAVATRALPWLGTRSMPRLAEASIDWRVIAYAGASTAVVAALVALLPVIRVTRLTRASAVTGGARSATGGRSLTRQTLIAAQVGLTVVLLLGATLLTSSFVRLLAVDPGYSTERVLAIDLTLPDSDYPDASRTTALFARLIDGLRQESRVVAAGAVANLPLAAGDGDINIQIEGRETVRGAPSRRANWQVVTPGYFEAMRMRLIRGRTIAATDMAGAPGVVVISQSMADAYWPGTDAIGARFRLGGGAGPGVVTVIGVVADIKHNALTERPMRQMYLAHQQFTFWGGGMEPARSMTVVVRADGPEGLTAAAVRRQVRALDPALPLGEVRTMAQVRADSVSRPRFLVLLLSAFSLVALIVALVGVYCVVSYAVTERRREIGVRMAIGGTPGTIIGLMVRQGLTPALVGIASGLLAGVALSGTLRTLLFEVSPRDPVVAMGVASAVALATCLACYLPARRAGSTNPVVALRLD